MCFVALLAIFSARLADVFLWIFTDLVTRAFHGSLIAPLLGIAFLPWTTLMYVLVYSPAHGGVYGLGWFFVGLGVLFDIGSYTSGAYSNRSHLGYT